MEGLAWCPPRWWVSGFTPYFLNAFCTSSPSDSLVSLLPPSFPVVCFLYSHQNDHLKSCVRACHFSTLNFAAFCISLRVEAEVLAMACKTLQGLLLSFWPVIYRLSSSGPLWPPIYIPWTHQGTLALGTFVLTLSPTWKVLYLDKIYLHISLCHLPLIHAQISLSPESLPSTHSYATCLTTSVLFLLYSPHQ